MLPEETDTVLAAFNVQKIYIHEPEPFRTQLRKCLGRCSTHIGCEERQDTRDAQERRNAQEETQSEEGDEETSVHREYRNIRVTEYQGGTTLFPLFRYSVTPVFPNALPRSPDLQRS